MSRVSGVTFICSCLENEHTLLELLNNGVRVQRDNVDRTWFTQLTDLYCGGGKHPQLFSFGAGLNYLNEDAFAAFVMKYTYEEPSNVILVINPEDGPIRIWRP